MSLSKPQIVAVFGFLVLIIIIPLISLIIKQRIDAENAVTQKYNQPVTDNNAQPVPPHSPLDNSTDKALALADTGNPQDNASESAQVSYGPTMSFTITMEGRPANNQSGKVFVGVAEGNPQNNPQYLLSFTVNMPASGSYSGLSLIGLTQGTHYTAYIKGPAQIVKAVPFQMNPTGTVLNQGLPIALTTWDLNEDNVIDSADISVAKAALATTPKSVKWNPNIDLNLDGVVNNLDLAIVTNNLGKIGDGGPWYSRID